MIAATFQAIASGDHWAVYYTDDGDEYKRLPLIILEAETAEKVAWFLNQYAEADDD